jgi:heat shock protein HslJ/uncharacterized membrane protein
MVIGLLLAGSAAAAAADSLTARGNEPFWRLDIGPGELSFELLGKGPAVSAPIRSRDVADGHPRILAMASGGPLEVTVIQRPCADTMTGMPFPVGVEVTYGGQRYTGCGGEIMTAIEGGWRVIRIEGAQPPEGVTVTVMFGRDGQVSGRSGCNRYSGGYTLTGEGLTIGPLATTRMACPPPGMETEQQVLGLLGKVTRVTPGENGQMVLMAGDEPALVLDRAD